MDSVADEMPKGGNVLAKVLSSAVIGIDAYLVEVEVDIAQGLPNFTTVGLPETAVKESKERVKAAISNSGYRFPDDRITVNLAPASIKKEGTGFDLPIALGILAATRVISQEIISKYLILVGILIYTFGNSFRYNDLKHGPSNGDHIQCL